MVDNRAQDTDEIVYLADNIADGALEGISVRLRRGEVLGVAGLVGSGRTRLVRIMAGAHQPRQGTLCLNGQIENSTVHAPRLIEASL